jgi:hypothetical protein
MPKYKRMLIWMFIPWWISVLWISIKERQNISSITTGVRLYKDESLLFYNQTKLFREERGRQ